MSQKLNIDLEKNPEVKDLIASMEVGDSIFVRGSIANMDDKNLEVRLKDVSDSAEGVAESAESDDDEDSEDEEDTEE